MPSESFRFIHASDFHLERPLGDLESLPSHLCDLMTQAPRRAVESVFEAALSDHVDFVVLSGDLINPLAAGPYGMSLLLNGFESLQAKNKPIYWSGGIADDPDAWPESIELPDNVTLFSKQQTQVMPVERAGRTICRVVGRSSEGCLQLDIPSFQVDASSDLTIGVGYGDLCAADLTDGVINYWALGGRHQRESVEDSELRVAHYCGSTQGRSLQEEGHHGFSLIDVDGDQNIRIQHQDTDEFRYCRIRFDQKEVAAVGSVENLIGEKIYQLQVDHGSRHLLIAWEVVCSDANELGALGDLDKILEWARCEYGQGEPAAWSLSMTLTPPTEYPQEWLNEETILGDFLRVAEKHYHDEKVPLDLTPLTEEHLSIRSPTASKLAEVSSPDRLETLSNATKIGVELLRGGKPDWVQNG